MSQQLATTQRTSPLAVMAAKFNADPAKLLETLKATVFSSARSNEELQALVIVANSYNLNPLTKEIYAFPAKGGGIVPVISIDGWANLANSHPQMDGMDFEWQHDDKGALISCTCIIYRKDRSRPTRVTEYLSECKRSTDPWKMEHRMLRHKALCQCVRIAFGFSGVYDEDEAERIGERDVTPLATESKLFKDTPATNGKAKPEAPAEDAQLIDAPTVSRADQVREKLKASGIVWHEIVTRLLKSGLATEEYASVEDAPDEVLSEVINRWPQLVAMVKGKGEGK
jgi:phage recombination protein Bet